MTNFKFWKLEIARPPKPWRRRGNWKFFVIWCLVLGALPAVAWALEVDFPSVQDVEVTDSMGPAQWVRYLFLISQALVGLAIIYALVRSGVEWMTARDNAAQVKVAKDRITGAVLGLVILLGSYIFLYTINPQLVNIRNPSIPQFRGGMFDFYGQVFLGGEAGSRCGADFNCRRGLKCEENSCVADPGAAGSSRSGCSNTNTTCAQGYRCLDNTTGQSIATNVNSEGTCTAKQVIGEECTVNTGVNFAKLCFKGTCVANKNADGTDAPTGKCTL